MTVSQINGIAGANTEDAPNVTNKDPSAMVNTISAMGDNDTGEERGKVYHEEEEKVKPRI